VYELTAPPFFGPEAAVFETRLEGVLELLDEEEPVVTRRKSWGERNPMGPSLLPVENAILPFPDPEVLVAELDDA
jgi:hypothetical protein